MTELKYHEGTLIGGHYKPGMAFSFKIAVPNAACGEFALLIEQDGQNDANVSSMLRLADEGKAPYCVSIGVMPGNLTMPNGIGRKMRMNSYDLFDREYGDFIVYELIPYVSEKYSIKFSPSPDMHFISGGSSGGICAFVTAWFHPDYFHRVYMSSPSFLAMGRGNEIPYLIRKYETKPLRVYEEYSENEPNDYFGWSKGIDEETKEALIFAGYDFKCAYFVGEGHCSRYKNEEEAYIRNEWIWRDWSTKKITPPHSSARVEKIVPPSSRWEVCDDLPIWEKSVPPSALSERFDKIVRSNDGQAWYAANVNDDVVMMFANDSDVSTHKGLLHATLHTIPRIYPKGAIDMAVDKADRLFVLTSIGVQCVRSFGLIDAILDLPDESKPLEIALLDALYVRTEKGIYKRALQNVCTISDDQMRKFTSYYD